jgi:hypothetical protein
MKARLYTPEDYPVIAEWQAKHGVPVVRPSMLSPLGVVIESEETGTMLGAVWIYLACNVGLAWLGWWVTNPANLPGLSERVINALEDASEAALPDEYNLLIAIPPTDTGLDHLLRRKGFHVSHTCTEMYKLLPLKCPPSQ